MTAPVGTLPPALLVPPGFTKKELERNEKARRALAVCHKMHRELLGVAKMFTRRPNIKLEWSFKTDSQVYHDTITMKVPIELGDLPEHDTRLCRKRDEDDILRCDACAMLEDVLITIIHEVAHIAKGTFEEVHPDERAAILRRAIDTEAKSKPNSARAKELKQRIDSADPRKFGDYLNLADLASPFLPFLLNCCEDIRVNVAMQDERPGTRKMFNAQTNRIFKRGFLHPDGSRTFWRDNPRNLQACIGVYCMTWGLPLDGKLQPEIVEKLESSEPLAKLVEKMSQAKSVRQIFRLSFPLLEEMRRLGFLLSPDDPEDEPEPEPEPKPEEQPDQDESEPQPKGDSEESDDGESSGDSGSNSTEDSDHSESEEDTNEESPSPGTDVSDDSPGEPSDDATDGDDDGTAPGGTDSEDDENSSEDSESGPSAGDDSSETDSDDSGGDSSVAEPDSDDGGNVVSEGNKPSDASGDGSEPSLDGPDTGQDDPALDQDGSDGPSTDTPECEPQNADKDSGEDDGEADGNPGNLDGEMTPPPVAEYTQEDMERDGTPEQVATMFNQFGRHGDDDNEGDESPVERRLDEEAIQRALEQLAVFDQPSLDVQGLRVTKNDDHTKAFGERGRASREQPDIPERLLVDALMKLRLVFQENAKTKSERHLRHGKVDGRALARRAPFDDDRMFKRNRHPGRRDHFVLVGIDCSYSTAAATDGFACRLDLMKASVFAMAELLHRLGVTFSVAAHSGSEHYVEIFEIKAPTDRWGRKERQALSQLQPYNANLDGHTLEYYRKVAAARTETDRSILYYTDGAMPAANFKEELFVLQREIATCQRTGIHLVGVGVETDSPKAHGLDTIRLDTVEDIPHLVTELKKRLGT